MEEIFNIMINRYLHSSDFPQPIRKIKQASTDILHPFKMGERIDNLAYKYYNDVTLGFIIMCGNPEYYNELAIPFGTTIRIPYPLSRVTTSWNIDKQI